MCGQSGKNDVVVGDECARRKENELKKGQSDTDERGFPLSYQSLRNVDARAPWFVVPGDTTSPSDYHEEGTECEGEHVALSTVSEPICRRFQSKTRRKGADTTLKRGSLAMKISIGIAYSTSPATASPKLGIKPKLDGREREYRKVTSKVAATLTGLVDPGQL